MKSTGMTRPIDYLGRVVIPMEIRESLNINPKDLLEIYLDGNQIILKKNTDSCVFCGSENELISFEGKDICKSCLAKINEASK
jgi:transcriptional pleiotropic regulator of transition state genes